MAQTRKESGLRRETLSNGLRVLLEALPGAPRASVSVHYGVGFRAEEPGWQGFAHLFEHLMFRGSANLPNGRFYDHVHRFGGYANGTTHQDYTDYYQTVPLGALEQALFAEADRMRAPTFTEENLAEQLEGIEREIDEAVTRRSYGGFPWPLLPAAMYRTFVNAHDGYGDLSRLRRSTVDDCAEFFETHYSPSNAVLTVVGDIEPSRVLRLVERHFGDIPARPVAPPPCSSERLDADRWLSRNESGVRAPAVAVGYPLPDPERDRRGYLTHMVLAAMLDGYGRETGHAPNISAGCGFFGPLDARDPDPLVVTALVPPEVSPESVPRVLERQWEEWSRADGLDELVERAVSSAVVRRHRIRTDLAARCRELGRSELLFGAAEQVDELPEQLATITSSEVAHAARALRAAPRGILVVEPGEQRDEFPAAPGDVAGASADWLGRGRSRTTVRTMATAGGVREFPACAEQPELRLGERRDEMVYGGPRVVAIVDDRVPVVELRLRLPLGLPGWRDTSLVEGLVGLLEERVRAGARARAFGGELVFSVDGQWLDVEGHAPTERVDAWLSLLHEALSTRGFDGYDETSVRRRADFLRHQPDRMLDDLLRRRWLEEPCCEEFPDGTSPTLDALFDSVTDLRDGVLIAVGDLDPETFRERVEEVLASDTAGGRRVVRPVPSVNGPVTVSDHEHDEEHVLLCRPESVEESSSPARYLATAVAGGYFRSRLAARSIRHGREGYRVFAGRDAFLDGARVYVRATLPRGRVAEALAEIRAELSGLSTDPPSESEVGRAREFCAAQMLGVADSPATLADMVRGAVAMGGSVDWLERLPVLLNETATAEVVAAAEQLFAGRSSMNLLFGDVDP
ncbi:M16 family metallopeptidase [Actinopolyspora mortivallis]|uniref:Peptidase M16 n=1 Tax=Actinopolyspora mortivallis TaxID=33906 RepID=A0A2T0GSG8_ACTMO|nr:M16 family metallopeptidase [Actinopolyspora mortivallis]PRW62037.1 hypothetical protein CEP50_17500 [Actinopolyspora mortivallis]